VILAQAFHHAADGHRHTVDFRGVSFGHYSDTQLAVCHVFSWVLDIHGKHFLIRTRKFDEGFVRVSLQRGRIDMWQGAGLARSCGFQLLLFRLKG
jgi:hypothetical protein